MGICMMGMAGTMLVVIVIRTIGGLFTDYILAFFGAFCILRIFIVKSESFSIGVARLVVIDDRYYPRVEKI
jgi:hypothetical protein